jgi:hypothetical protein
VLALTGALFAHGAGPGPVSFAVALTVAAGLALFGALLAGRVVPVTAAGGSGAPAGPDGPGLTAGAQPVGSGVAG